MKNQISHDSINRVEPSARFLSEQKTKIEANEVAINKSNEDENKKKETSVTESGKTDELDTDKEGHSEKKKYQKNSHSKIESIKNVRTNHFFGGQIFDSEA